MVFARSFALVSTAVALFALSTHAQGRHRFEHESVLGTSLDLTVDTSDAELAARVERAILAEIERLDAILSSYDADSEFSRFVATRSAQRVSVELLEVLQKCDAWGRATDGAFDAAFSDAKRAVGTAEASASYASPWTLDMERGSATLVASGPVRVDALAKGYVADRAVEVGMGVDERVLGLVVDLGGDLRVSGSRVQEVRVTNPLAPADNADPLCVLRLERQAVASSGSYARRIDGEDTSVAAAPARSRIRDPRTGETIESVAGVTVVAPSCADADALATALHVMQPGAGLALVESMDGFECIVVDAAGGVRTSSGIERLSVAGPVPASAAPPAAATTIAAAGLEVSLRFTIRTPTSKSRRSYRRPYVAAWIEDSDGKPVRTLCLWIEGRRWLRDLKTWYRLHRKDYELIDAVSRGTRRPGEYELVWRGNSDDGVDVVSGDYTLCLEVAREHGTHQLMKAPLTMKPDERIDLEPNEEIATAAVEVRRVGRGGHARK